MGIIKQDYVMFHMHCYLYSCSQMNENDIFIYFIV